MPFMFEDLKVYKKAMGLIDAVKYYELYGLAEEISKMLSGLIKSVR